MSAASMAELGHRQHVVPEATGAPRPMWAFRTIRGLIHRTAGAVVELPHGELLQEWGPQDAVAIRRLLNLNEADQTVARGKLAFFAHGGRPAAAVFQCSGSQACRVDCGNAAAAVAASFALSHRVRAFSYDLVASNGSIINVAAAVHDDGVDLVWDIRQDFALRHLEADGTEIAEADFLNLYYIVPPSFPIASLDRLAGATPALKRRVAIVDMSTDPPAARFWTCGRPHPSAPLTGLTVLAMAANEMEWLAPLRRRSAIMINGIPELLPTVEGGHGAWKVSLPKTECRLKMIGLVQNG